MRTLVRLCRVRIFLTNSSQKEICMKKLILLTLTFVFAISINAMEIDSESEETLSNTEKVFIPAVGRLLGARELLEYKERQLTNCLEKTYNEYKKINNQSTIAYYSSIDEDNPNQAQARIIYGQCEKQCAKILAKLKELEKEMQIVQYEWFINRIKHSKPTELQHAIEFVVGQYNHPPEDWYLNLKYCLFTREQKMKLIAYAQTIQTNRNAETYLPKGVEKLERRKPNPKILKKYKDACYVTLLMEEFKDMKLADQQKSYRYFHYQ